MNKKLDSNLSFQKSIKPIRKISGQISISGDKSISHRALLFSTLMQGENKIQGLLASEDVMHTKEACEKIGAQIIKTGENDFKVDGIGMKLPARDYGSIYLGNSGTSMRLIMGILAGSPGANAILTGDESLSKRPMERITGPLSQFSGKLKTAKSGLPPVRVEGQQLSSIAYLSDISSAQLKSALMFSSLMSQVPYFYGEKEKSRDHSERFLRSLDIEVLEANLEDGEVDNDFTLTESQKKQVKSWSKRGILYKMNPPYKIKKRDIYVPGDISSAAFFIVLAAILPDSKITINNVGLNPSRIGILEAVQKMGVKVFIEKVSGSEEKSVSGNQGEGEPSGNITIYSSETFGTVFEGSIIPNIIDEIPILSVLAAFSGGKTVFRGVQELRVKESDRIHAICTNLSNCGIEVQEWNDGFGVTGGRDKALGGTTVKTYYDHRIAMAFAIFGLASKKGVYLDDAGWIATSFPGFFDKIRVLVP